MCRCSPQDLGLRRYFPDVSVMKSADPRQRVQFRGVRPGVHGPRVRCVFVQAEVGPVLVIVTNELVAEAANMGLLERDHMVEAALAGTRPTSFGDSILPGAPDRRAHSFHPGDLHKAQHVGAEF